MSDDASDGHDADRETSATSRDRGGETADAEDGGRGSARAASTPASLPIRRPARWHRRSTRRPPTSSRTPTRPPPATPSRTTAASTRIANPTVTTLEDRLADLEGGAGAVATGSGMAALDSAVLILAEAGDNVVCSTDTYGGTTTYFSKTATRRDIEPKFVPTLEYDAYEEAIDEDTAFVHVETIGNPSLVTPDFERVAEVAHDNGVPLVVDNTFATPALCRPLEHGADVVWGVDDQVAPRLRHHGRRRAGRRRLVPLG